MPPDNVDTTPEHHAIYPGADVQTHDPQAMIHLLRDHMAAHDKRLTFLFGAGTSSAVNIAEVPRATGERNVFEPLIPAVARMTDLCHQAVAGLGEAHAAAWDMLVSECRRLELDANVESVLGRLRLKIEAATPGETILGLDPVALGQFEQTMRHTIAALASPSEAVIPDDVPHDLFARWIARARRREPIEVFTTNYDIMIERSLERLKVPYFDGFIGAYRPFFSPGSIDIETEFPGRGWTRVWKLHGSTNWQLVDGTLTRSSTVGAEDMILPSHRKYDESRKMPYVALMDRLTRRLSVDGGLLVTCGYSWSDQHINAVALTAIDSDRSNAVVALMFGDLDSVPHLVSLAEARSNLIVIGPGEGIIQGERRPWATPSIISRAAATVMDLPFDSDAVPELSGPVPGRMRLGDFNVFCRFLATMDADGVSR